MVGKGRERPPETVTGSRGGRPLWQARGRGCAPGGPPRTAAELRGQRLPGVCLQGTRVPARPTARPEQQDSGIRSVLSLSTVPKGESPFAGEREGRGPGTRTRAGSRWHTETRHAPAGHATAGSSDPTAKRGRGGKQPAQPGWGRGLWACGPPGPAHLVGRDVRVRREGQHAHDLADLVQLAPFGLAEVFPCVSRKRRLGSSQFASSTSGT